jgi:hypothetical protein
MFYVIFLIKWVVFKKMIIHTADKTIILQLYHQHWMWKQMFLGLRHNTSLKFKASELTGPLLHLLWMKSLKEAPAFLLASLLPLLQQCGPQGLIHAETDRLSCLQNHTSEHQIGQPMMHASYPANGVHPPSKCIFLYTPQDLCSSVADTNLQSQSYSHSEYQILQNQKLPFLALR